MRNILLSLSLLILISNLNGKNADLSNDFWFKAYLVVGKRFTLDTKAIPAAINSCTESGRGKAGMPAGKYQIGTNWLRSNVTLSLD